MMTERSLPIRNGFSITELLVALAISAVMMMAIVGMDLANLRSFYSRGNQASLGRDTISLIQYLRNLVMGAGGGSVRPWMAIWVENNCALRGPFPACGGSDRITIVTLHPPQQECAITGQVNPTTYQVAFSSPGVCCLQPLAAGEISFLNQPVMVSLNGNYSQQYITGVNTVTCQVTEAVGQQAGLNDQTGGTVNWTGGMISLVTVQTIYQDPVAHTLNQYMDLNNTNAVDPGDLMVIADQVFDLQVALGIDCNPPDGNIVATANGVGDEWLYNAPGVAEAWGFAPFVAPATMSELLLVQLGVMVGAQDATNPKASNTLSILDGPNRTAVGWTLQSELTQLAPRNSFIFQ